MRTILLIFVVIIINSCVVKREYSYNITGYDLVTKQNVEYLRVETKYGYYDVVKEAWECIDANSKVTILYKNNIPYGIWCVNLNKYFKIIE